MTLHIVAIGGTGARCAEALLHLAAIGLLPDNRLQYLFIDPDEANGNLARTKDAITAYRNCYNRCAQERKHSAWMQPAVDSLDLWTPFSESLNKSLGAFFKYETIKSNNPTLGGLFDVLYTEKERKAQLDVGFRGRPAIGAAVMSQVNLDTVDQEPWRSLIHSIELDVGNGRTSHVFLCGSIFGGTGASGFPTIARLIANKLDRLGIRERVKIGGALMLPYFNFAVPAGQGKEDIFARPEQFLLNTEAALRYYVGRASGVFNTIYLLGDPEPVQVKEFSIGKNTQNNDPHFVELFAALAARNFTQKSSDLPLVLVSRGNVNQLSWNDLPETDQVKPALVQATRFAIAWTHHIVPELEKVRQMGVGQFQKVTPWFSRYYRPKTLFGGKSLPEVLDEQEQDTIQVITRWAKSYLRWLRELHHCTSDIQLFNLANLASPQPSIENFSNLAVEDSGQKTIELLRQRLDQPPTETGTVGLAKALYTLCSD